MRARDLESTLGAFRLTSKYATDHSHAVISRKKAINLSYDGDVFV
jgi:hypothetical protein